MPVYRPALPTERTGAVGPCTGKVAVKKIGTAAWQPTDTVLAVSAGMETQDHMVPRYQVGHGTTHRFHHPRALVTQDRWQGHGVQLIPANQVGVA